MRASDPHQDPGRERGAASAKREDPRGCWVYLWGHVMVSRCSKSAERGVGSLESHTPESGTQGGSTSERMYPPSSRMGGARSCSTGPSGRYSLIGTLRTLYALSLSGAPCGSAEGGRVCIDDCPAGGEPGRAGKVVGVTFDATRQ
jgi:hypothetical protein